jgi:hypothetical protein
MSFQLAGKMRCPRWRWRLHPNGLIALFEMHNNAEQRICQNSSMRNSVRDEESFRCRSLGSSKNGLDSNAPASLDTIQN